MRDHCAELRWYRSGLTGGKYDAIIAGMSITAKRREVIDFTQPYVSSPSQFATLKGGGLEGLPGSGGRFDLGTAEAGAKAAIDAMKVRLKGKVLGVQGSTLQADFANISLKGVVEVRAYRSSDEVLLELSSGRADAALLSAAVVRAAMEKSGGQDLVLTGPGFSGGTIKEATADGTLARLSMLWFKLALTSR